MPDASANDELSPPFAQGDTLEGLIRRLSGISEGGVTNIMPGWDWSVIISGLKGAVYRYGNSLGSERGIASRVAVGEALWWISAADEFIRKRVSNSMPMREYCPRMQRTAAGLRLAGLVYLRNRAGHQLAAVLHQSVASASTGFKVTEHDGTASSHTVTGHLITDMKPFETSPADGYFFAPSSSLPEPDPEFSERFLRDVSYEDLVARRKVSDVLEAVTRSLDRTISFEQSEMNIALKITGSGTLPRSGSHLHRQSDFTVRKVGNVVTGAIEAR